MPIRKHACAAALTACLAALPAYSANNGFYLGGALGQSESGLRNGTLNFKDRDQGFKLIAGVRPLSLLAVEVNYVDFGTATLAPIQAKTRATDGFVLLFLPVPVVDIYGKLGAVSWKTDTSAPGVSLHTSGTDLAFGAGVQLQFGGLGARLEYEAFDAQAASRPTFLSLGLTYTFL